MSYSSSAPREYFHLQPRRLRLALVFPLANKFQWLRTVCLDQPKNLQEEHLLDTVSFVTANRATFPLKKPLHVGSGGTWNMLNKRGPPPQELRDIK